MKNVDLYAFHRLRRLLKLSLQIECSTVCNLKCKGCYRTIHDYPHKNKLLLFDEFKFYIDQMPNRLGSLTLHGLGEPMLNPDISKIVDYVMKTKPCNIEFTTNFLAAEYKDYIDVLEKGLGMLTISVDSLDQKEVDRLRNGTDVEELIRRIKLITKTKHNRRTLFWITVSKLNLDTYVNTTERLLELGARKVFYQVYLDYGIKDFCLSEQEKKEIIETSKKLKEKYKGRVGRYASWFEKTKRPCHRITAPFITVDGRILPCCLLSGSTINPIGNIHDKPFKELYYSKKVTKMYQNIKNGKYFPFCGSYASTGHCDGKHIDD